MTLITKDDIIYFVDARVAELADAQDLKSCEGQTSYRFDSGLSHHLFVFKNVEISMFLEIFSFNLFYNYKQILFQKLFQEIT